LEVKIANKLAANGHAIMYNKGMNFLRKAALATVCSLLPMALLGFGILFSLYQVLGSPNHIKGALAESGFYDSALASVVEQTTDAEGGGDSQTSSGQAAVQKAIKDAIPASYIQDQTSGVLDGVYAWMQGKSTDLQFAIDLTPVKTDLVNSLTEQARARAQTLPACGPNDTVTADSDPFSATCLPAGTNPDQVAEKTRQTVLESEMFKDASITPQSMQKKGDRPLSEQLAPVKDGYQSLRKALYISGLLVVVFIGGTILLSLPRRTGIRRVSYILLAVGATGIAIALIGSGIARAIIESLAKDSNGELYVKAAEAFQLLVDKLRNWWIILGCLSVAIGIAAIVGVKLWSKGHPTDPTPDKRAGKDGNLSANPPVQQIS
jgi:hypothetical protein